MLYFFLCNGYLFLSNVVEFFFLYNVHFFLSKVVYNSFLSNVIEVVLDCMEKNLQLSYKMYEIKKSLL